jgi:hypothetical protein
MNNREVVVFLNVYDLNPELNAKWASWGFGAYHTGVEVDGVEWSFGGHDGPHTGVFKIAPRSCPDVRFLQSITMGVCVKSRSEIQRILDNLMFEFSGNSYHLLNRNCNHFSNTACERLLQKSIPSWVNRLAYTGSWFQCLLPPDLGQRTPNAENVSAASSSSSSFSSIRTVQAFSGEGRKLTDSIGTSTTTSSTSTSATTITSSTAEVNDGDRRELLARAALRRFESANN